MSSTVANLVFAFAGALVVSWLVFDTIKMMRDSQRDSARALESYMALLRTIADRMVFQDARITKLEARAVDEDSSLLGTLAEKPFNE